MKIYLGGILAKSNELKAEIIASLKANYFDPSTTEENFEGLTKRKEEFISSDLCVYVVSPLMDGFKEIIDVVDDSNKLPDKTVFCYVNMDAGKTFTDHQIKSLQRIGEMVEKNGATWCKSIPELITYLNSK